MIIWQILPFLVSIGALVDVFLYVYRQRKSGLRINYLVVVGWGFVFVGFLYLGFARL